PFQTFVAVAPSPWARGKQVVHIGLQGYTLPKANRPPVNLTFLVDVSGSMDPADRLPLAKKSLNLLIDQLRPQDRVSMAVYAGAAGTVLEPTPGTDKLRMRCAVEALNAGGSTAGGAGLALAYRLAKQNYRAGQVNRVILMTDGDFNVGVTNNKSLEDFVADQRKSGIYLSVYGYGRGNYQDARMQTISQAGNGTAGYVDSLTEARRLFAQEFTRELFPIADDVKIQVEFNPARVSDYRLIGYETRLLNREDFNNDKVYAGEVGTGASVTALYEITPVRTGGSVDPLRYQREARQAPAANQEIAFLKLRYKPPGGRQSILTERPITDRDAVARLENAPEQTRWALAVAAYGQRLRGDPSMQGDFDWGDIRQLAASAKGEDALGVRAEFLDLVRKASGRGMALGQR
ncbi:MAG: YfbK domain-containing protein, partial [Caulobacteraceae bacterium]